MPTAGRDMTMDNLKGLMSFTGAASDVVSNYLEEQTQKDALKQIESFNKTGKATDDATVGGYRAAASLGIANWNQARNARDLEFAKTNPSDEQLRERAMDEDRQAMEYLSSNYEYLKSDPELLKAVSMNTIEQMPTLAKAREVARLEQEQVKRTTAFNERVLMSKGMTAEEFPSMIESMTSSLQIDQATAKASLIGTAIESGDVGLMELVSGTTLSGDKLPLGESNGKLRTALSEAKGRETRKKAGEIAEAKVALDSELSSGNMTEDEYYANADLLNERYNGQAYTPEQLYSNVMRNRDELSKGNLRANNISSMISNPSVNNTYGMKKAEMDDAAIAIYDDIVGDLLFDVPQAERTPDKITQIKAQAVKSSAELYAKNGLTNPLWDSGFTSVSTLSPMSAIYEDANGNQQVRPDVLETLNVWSILTPQQRAQYSGGKESTLLANYDLMTSTGSTPVEALMAVNEMMLNPKPVSNKEFLNAADGISEELFDRYFWEIGQSDISQSARDLLNDEIQRRLHVYGSANEATVSKVTEDLRLNSTQLSNGQVLLANPQVISQKLGVHQDRINGAFDVYSQGMSGVVGNLATAMGWDSKDFNLKLDNKTGTVYMVDPIGLPVPSSFKSLRDLGKEYYDEQDIKKAARYDTVPTGSFGNVFYTDPTKL